jgi:hypothetical protein
MKKAPQPLDDQPRPVGVESATLPFDLLHVKRTVEVHVTGGLRSVRLLAEVGSQLRDVAIPGGEFSLGISNPELLLSLLKLVTGYRFERLPPRGHDDEDEIWVRADHPSRRRERIGNA